MIYRGISSTVRRCIEKETGKEYAAKIIDLSNETQDSVECHTMRDATKQEVNILRLVMSHPYISEFMLVIIIHYTHFFISFKEHKKNYCCCVSQI